MSIRQAAQLMDEVDRLRALLEDLKYENARLRTLVDERLECTCDSTGDDGSCIYYEINRHVHSDKARA